MDWFYHYRYSLRERQGYLEYSIFAMGSLCEFCEALPFGVEPPVVVNRFMRENMSPGKGIPLC